MKRTIGVNSNCYHGYSVEDALEGIAAAGPPPRGGPSMCSQARHLSIWTVSGKR